MLCHKSCHLNEVWALIQYKDVILPVKKIPLWRKDGRNIVLSSKWDFLYWYDGIFIVNQLPREVTVTSQKLVILGSCNGCLSSRCQVITCTNAHFDGLVQKRRNSSALAMELHLSCTNPSIYWHLKTILGTKFKIFLLRKVILKCYLQNVGNFVLATIC